MRLVDREQRQRHFVEHVEEILIEHSLRCNVKQLQLTRPQVPFYLTLGVLVETGVEERGTHAKLMQCLDLVLHQGNQRRYDNGSTGADQCGNLVAQRLAAAGRHQHQCITTRDDLVDDRLLLAAKCRVTKYVIENL